MTSATTSIRRGPKFPLLYHVAISGDIGMADIVKPHLIKDRLAQDRNRSLQPAAGSGDVIMVECCLQTVLITPMQKTFLAEHH